MAHYTVELRKLIYYYGQEEIKSWFNDYELSDYLTSSQIEVITNSGIWSKDKLATNIVEWYYMREIGFDTPALFEHYAKATMKQVMEKYLPIIYTKCLDYNILNNVSVTETIGRMSSESGSNQASNNGISNTSGSGLQVNSDTPQGEITKANILNGSYASNTSANETSANISESTASSSNGEASKSESVTKNVTGKDSNKTYQELIKEYRENIIAVNSEIIKELNSLFLGLYI